MFARRHLDFLAEPFDISNRLVDAVFGVARALVDEGVTRLTERASFLELQPAPGAMRFARRAAQISHAAFEHEAMGEFHGKSREVMW